MEIDDVIAVRCNFFHEMKSKLCGQRTIVASWKAAVEVSAIWQLALEVQKTKNIKDGKADDGAFGRLVELFAQEATDNFYAVEFVSVQASHH